MKQLNIHNHIESSLNRKDVSMMFSNKKYKSILFDDSIDINNILIKNIIKHIKKCSIVITSSNINMKIKSSLFYVIELSKEKFTQIEDYGSYESQYNTIGLNILENIKI